MIGAREVLPRRGFGLRVGFYARRSVAVLVLLLMTAGAVWGAIWAVGGAWSLRRDQAVWAHGVPAVDGAVRGTVQSKGLRWILRSYDLEVWYDDAAGVRHEGPLELTTMFGGADTDGPTEIRYDAADPNRFTVGWAVEASGARWRWIIIGGGMIVLLAAVFAFGTWVVTRDVLALRRCARRGDEVVVRIKDARGVNDAKGRGTSKRAYTLGLGELVWTEEMDRAKGEPLYADAGERSAYAVVSADRKERIFLRGDLYPLSVSAAERAEVVRRVEAAHDPLALDNGGSIDTSAKA